MANRFIDFSALNGYQDKTVQTEGKQQPYGLITLAQNNTPFCKILSPSLVAHLQTVEGRTTQYPGLKESTITTTSVESFTIPQHLSVSEMKTLSMVTVFSGFRIYPKYFVNNIIDYQSYLNNKLDEVFKAMAVAKEAQILSVLSTNKSQVFPGEAQINGGDGVFTFQAADVLDINKAAQKDSMFANLKTLFRINRFSGEIEIVVNVGGFNLALNEIYKFGATNQENRQFIQNQMPTYYESLSISPGSDQFVAYAIEKGAIGMVENYPSDFRVPVPVGEKRWGITDSPMPYINARVNTFYNREAVDASALGETTSHLLMTHYEEWAFIDKFFVVGPYNSDITTRVNPILYINGKTS